MGIIQNFKKLKSVWSWKRIIGNIGYFIKTDFNKLEFEMTYKIKDEVIEECAYELEDYKNHLTTLQVLDSNETVKMLANYPKSFSRFGDGEIKIMQGKDQPFQKYDPVLAEKMFDILKNKRDDMYVGLNKAYFQSPSDFAERNRKFYRVYGTEYRRFFSDHCDSTNIYLDASCFGAYFRFDDTFDYEGHYDRIKELFRDKKIAIICGEGVIEKLDYDIFERASQKKIVHGPRINAFSEYDALLKKIESEVDKDYLICMILGMTATVLAADLTDMGYIAWDVGHVAKDYDAYKKQTEKSQKNMDAFWAPD